MSVRSRTVVTFYRISLVVGFSAWGCGEVAPALDAPRAEGAQVASAAETILIESEELTIDRRIDSMDGPAGVRRFVVPGARPGELVWLTAVRNSAIDAETGDPMSQEFLCHSNLTFTRADQGRRSNAAFRATDPVDSRIVTLIQGQNEIELPPGHGVPLVAGEPIEFFTMVINKNEDDLPFGLKVRTEIEYVRDAASSEPVVPLFRRRLHNFVKLEDGAAGRGGGQSGHGSHGSHGSGGEGGEGGQHAAMGHPGMGHAEAAPSASTEATLGIGRDGTTYGMHWLVPPGRHVFRNDVTAQLRIPFATSLHFASAHLHPFGESVELVDLATGEIVLRLEAHMYEDRVGIAEMDSFSSAEGIGIDPGGHYELVTTYNNATDQPIDAMAILYLYLRDQAFQRLEG